MQTLILTAKRAHTHKQFLLLARLGEQAFDREGSQNINKSQVFGCEKARMSRPESYMEPGTTCLPHLTFANPGVEQGKVKELGPA